MIADGWWLRASTKTQDALHYLSSCSYMSHFMFAALYTSTYYGVSTDALHKTDIFGSSATLTEVLCTSSSNQPWFEPMTSRLWTALLCPCDTRLTTELYGILKRNVHVLPHYLWGLTWACAGLSKWCTGNWYFWLKYDRQKYYTHPKFDLTGV